MIVLRKAKDRGQADHGWLKTAHTFSFGDYFDRRHMSFRSLRVINDDWIAPATGFPTHPHQDMEIITYVLSGELAHRDSMGNGSIIKPGEVQRMTAGTGVYHSEANPSESEALRLLQIWIVPEKKGLEPGYEQKFFSRDEKLGRLRVVASRDGRENSVTVHQDMSFYASVLGGDETVSFENREERFCWIQVARGQLTVESQNSIHQLEQGDGVAISGREAFKIFGRAGSEGDAEFLLFDLN